MTLIQMSVFSEQSHGFRHSSDSLSFSFQVLLDHERLQEDEQTLGHAGLLPDSAAEIERRMDSAGDSRRLGQPGRLHQAQIDQG